MAQQAWSFKAIEQDDLRYWGNDGYHDNSSVFYRYDSFVANHKNVKEGDIVIVTNRDSVLGVSIIDIIATQSTIKKRNKCSHLDCNAKKILPRKTIKPEWRCDNGHQFDVPRVLFEPAVEFIANYGEYYKEITDISISQLITETPRYNGQMSIQEVNLQWAIELLGSIPADVLDLKAEEADNDIPNLMTDDLRKIVERQIKQRRGQQKFRDKLLKSNPICAVTGCELVDILEAAHIDAYRNDSHNHISNGLLLRSDIHTLFDLHLFAIEPETNSIRLSTGPLQHGYQQFEGANLKIKHKISHSVLLERWKKFNSLKEK
ncbi:HNH endonuclease [Serratia sp. 3ACOL1]|uniref:HNH endonuclease n=1 Tax=Serratia sp. 3ACOL1 TaxID=2448483 RepID=UPI000EF500A0|nr:HNH endonuclease signature motif containing protein [Serratia sp. 3ACOL1]AYM93891.1 HNH endonuclease [Serratia sp. 3ACOL1]